MTSLLAGRYVFTLLRYNYMFRPA